MVYKKFYLLSMKVNKLETHDRWDYFQKQEFSTDEYLKKLVDSKPWGDHPYYIFLHTRQTDTTQDRRCIWQTRLVRPYPQLNTSLFRVGKNADFFEVIWVIPSMEVWDQFGKGKVCENAVIERSIQDFKNNPWLLSQPHVEDLPPEKAQEIMFSMYPLMFDRDTLPEDKKSIWDAEKRKKEEKV
jgi:hypothetical protein